MALQCQKSVSGTESAEDPCKTVMSLLYLSNQELMSGFAAHKLLVLSVLHLYLVATKVGSNEAWFACGDSASAQVTVIKC